MNKITPAALDLSTLSSRRAALANVQAQLSALFSYANGLPEEQRYAAREAIRDAVTAAASTPPSRPDAQLRPIPPRKTSPNSPAKCEMRLVPVKLQGKPNCRRCGGTGLWKGSFTSAPCFCTLGRKAG